MTDNPSPPISRKLLVAARIMSVTLQLLFVAWMAAVYLAHGKYSSQLNYALWIGFGLYFFANWSIIKRAGKDIQLDTPAMKWLNYAITALFVVFAIVVPSQRWNLIFLAVIGVLFLLGKWSEKHSAKNASEPGLKDATPDSDKS